MKIENLSKLYGTYVGCQEINLELFAGEVLGIVGESGSGKTTLLRCMSAQMIPTSGNVYYQTKHDGMLDIAEMTEFERRLLMRTDWGFVHQNPYQGLRMNVSAGANISERPLSIGGRNFGRIRGAALEWLKKVELPGDRIDDLPQTYSGGMLQRLQLARNLVNSPRLVLMDEPTSSLDVSVQAKLLDLLRSLVRTLNLSAIIVTHNLAVARHLSQRLVVMQNGRIVESGLTDQVLDDPQHAYTQSLVLSILHH